MLVVPAIHQIVPAQMFQWDLANIHITAHARDQLEQIPLADNTTLQIPHHANAQQLKELLHAIAV
jgi:hypothetical protein